MGASLLVYAAGLFRNAVRKKIDQTEARIAVILDAAWVAGSAVAIFAGVFSAVGNWIAATVADIVLLFGVLQFYGIRKMQRRATSESA